MQFNHACARQGDLGSPHGRCTQVVSEEVAGGEAGNVGREDACISEPILSGLDVQTKESGTDDRKGAQASSVLAGSVYHPSQPPREEQGSSSSGAAAEVGTSNELTGSEQHPSYLPSKEQGSSRSSSSASVEVGTCRTQEHSTTVGEDSNTPDTTAAAAAAAIANKGAQLAHKQPDAALSRAAPHDEGVPVLVQQQQQQQLQSE
eukprot:scaffold269055_cov19-Tisochrysis_lutea.AAC.1